MWHACRLGRGAADGLSCDALETAVFSRQTFDRNGLIVACSDSQIVGFVHAGFGPNADQTDLDSSRGVICIVVVHPDFRGQGIGRELVRRAEEYLKAAGSTEIFAGSAEPLDPFYIGVYGGVQPAGFLESDPDASGFMLSLGYEPVERHLIFQRSIVEKGEPVNFRLMTVRRKMKLAASDKPPQMTWWWITRFGDLDTIDFLLLPKAGGSSLATLTAVGLDHYLPKWEERVVGLTNIHVPESERRHGYAQTLILDVCRRLRDELVTRIEIHAPEADDAAVNLLKSCGFEQVDAGVVYRRGS